MKHDGASGEDVHMRFNRGVTRRQIVVGSGAAALAHIALSRSAAAADKSALIIVVINQSP
jgi:hypothetical protein